MILFHRLLLQKTGFLLVAGLSSKQLKALKDKGKQNKIRSMVLDLHTVSVLNTAQIFAGISSTQVLEDGLYPCTCPQKILRGGTIRKYDFVTSAMALLEEVYHCGVCFEVSYMLKPHPVPQVTSYCFRIKEVEFLAPSPTTRLPAHHHVLPS